MQTRIFNNNFFITPEPPKEIDPQALALFLESIYEGRPPIYFNAWKTTQPENVTQKDFQRDPLFRTQITLLLTQLEKWAIANGVISQKHNQLQELLNHLLNPNYYSEADIDMFSDGIKSLETLLYRLSTEKNITRSKHILKNILAGLVKCGSGAYSFLQEALLEFTTDVSMRLALARLEVIKQIAIVFIRENNFALIEGNEVHYANAFANFLGDDYGLPPIKDKLANPKNISTKDLEAFLNYIIEHDIQFTIGVIETLAHYYENHLREILPAPYAQILFFFNQMDALGEDANAFDIISGYTEAQNGKLIENEFPTKDLYTLKDSIYENEASLTPIYSPLDIHRLIKISLVRRLMSDASQYLNKERFRNIQMINRALPPLYLLTNAQGKFTRKDQSLAYYMPKGKPPLPLSEFFKLNEPVSERLFNILYRSGVRDFSYANFSELDGIDEFLSSITTHHAIFNADTIERLYKSGKLDCDWLNLQNINFHRISPHLENMSFSHSSFNNVDFSHSTLMNIHFLNATLINVDFTKATLEKIQFKNCCIDEATLRSIHPNKHINLEGSSITGQLAQLNLSSYNLYDINIADQQTDVDVNLSGSLLNRHSIVSLYEKGIRHFNDTILYNEFLIMEKSLRGEHNYASIHVDLSQLNLTDANFSHADLRRVNFAHANLRGTNFTNAKLYGDENFTGTIYDPHHGVGLKYITYCTGNALTTCIQLLKYEYIKEDKLSSQVNRFFCGNWNRKHIADVKKVLQEIASNPEKYTSVKMILERLGDNYEESLSRQGKLSDILKFSLQLEVLLDLAPEPAMVSTASIPPP